MARRAALVALALVALGCSSAPAPTGPAAPGPGPTPPGDSLPDSVIEVADAVPLPDFTREETYRGFPGGLYPDGDSIPEDHLAAGLARAREIRPRDAAGRPDPGGRIVLLVVGADLAAGIGCSATGAPPCEPGSLAGRVAAGGRWTPALLVADAGWPGHYVGAWNNPLNKATYDRVRDSVLAPLGATEAQVQVAWVLLSNPRPHTPTWVTLPHDERPDSIAEAYRLLRGLSNTVQVLRDRYPNLRVVLLSGHPPTITGPESAHPPRVAYEDGFSAKWLIETQIRVDRGEVVTDPFGDWAEEVDYTAAPWMAWLGYLWAPVNGPPNRFGLSWSRGDFEPDGIGLDRAGRARAAGHLLDRLAAEPYTRCWAVAGAGGC